MDDFAMRSGSDRQAFFTEAAARMGVLPLIVEKDFWVSWSLKRVFEMNDVPGHIFKGGTSLSKVFRLIDRFSEDIDISLDRAGLGFSGEKDPAHANSKSKRNKLTKSLRERCANLIEVEILPRFQKACRLGPEGWSVTLDERDPDRQSILFQYPRSLAEYGAGAYLNPSVMLEFGARGDQWPANEKTLQPFVAEIFPDQFRNPSVSVRVLAAERTFWKKVTLMHIQNGCPRDKKVPTRLSRHYSDVARIYRNDIGKAALTDTKLLAEVVNHKRVFFSTPWADYDKALPGSLALVPNPDLKKELRADYLLMKDMFFGEPETFDSILATIRDLETELNSVGRAEGATSV